MKKVQKYSRWSEEDRKELALIIQRGLNKNSTVQNACAYAAKKLGRTRQGCEFQWHHWIKDSLSTYLIPTVVDEEVKTEEAVKEQVVILPESKHAFADEKAEHIVEKVEPETKLPTIEVHSTMNTEIAEIIAHADGTIIARASRGIIIVIKP